MSNLKHEPGRPVKLLVKISNIITCSSKELSLLEQMEISDIFTSFSKELFLLEQVMMSDIFTSFSKELSVLEQVMMLDIFTSNFTRGLAPASNQTFQRIYICSWLARGKMSERKVILNFQTLPYIANVHISL